jgi:hypothetical protein
MQKMLMRPEVLQVMNSNSRKTPTKPKAEEPLAPVPEQPSNYLVASSSEMPNVDLNPSPFKTTAASASAPNSGNKAAAFERNKILRSNEL